MPRDFKEIFCELLLTNNTTAYRVAKNLNISQGTMNQYKNGVTMPSQKNLAKIADFFNVSVDYLIGRTSSSSDSECSTMSDSTIESINNYGKNTSKILELFNQLNSIGQQKAIENLEDLTSIEKYTSDEEFYIVKKAARNGSFEKKIITKEELDMINSLQDVDDLE